MRTELNALYRRAGVWIALLVSFACATGRQPQPETSPDLAVPEWSQQAIWYQIFVERFRNGDPDNDPRPRDIRGSWPDVEAPGWKVTPWGWDWYRQEDWAQKTGEGFYTTVQMRRYGGDLQGVLDQLDYLQELGATAIYLNPINDAPSLHKYDARNYRHVDRNFGPSPDTDERMMASEDPDDPSTWQWTAADQLFLQLIREVHARNMRVIVDYSWNHTGVTFWAWQDLLKLQLESPYSDWYRVLRFDDPATPVNEFAYRGWAGVPSLPEFAKVGVPPDFDGGPVEGTLHPEVKRHVLAVTQRWLDPNGDGDPRDGVDGFRLDVAEKIPLGFWREYRRFVRSVNPEAFLMGEVWWQDWPDQMYDPDPWLQGDVFDSVMHYRWYEPTRSFLTGAPPALTATQYRDALEDLRVGLSPEFQRALVNLTASHDSPRTSTSLFNPGRYKYQVNPRENPGYKVHRPDPQTRRIQKMLLVQQFTYVGAPHIWNGDEIGMWGADDPDNRKPLIWPDLKFDPERIHPLGKPHPVDQVKADLDLLDFYRMLIRLRRDLSDLWVEGDLEWLAADDDQGIVAYRRSHANREAVVAINRSSKGGQLTLRDLKGVSFRDALAADLEVPVKAGVAVIDLPPQTARILVSE